MLHSVNLKKLIVRERVLAPEGGTEEAKENQEPIIEGETTTREQRIYLRFPAWYESLPNLCPTIRVVIVNSHVEKSPSSDKFYIFMNIHLQDKAATRWIGRKTIKKLMFQVRRAFQELKWPMKKQNLLTKTKNKIQYTLKVFQFIFLLCIWS